MKPLAQILFTRDAPDVGKDIQRLWGSIAFISIAFDTVKLFEEKSNTEFNFFAFVSGIVLFFTGVLLWYSLFVKLFGEGVLGKYGTTSTENELVKRAAGKRTKLFIWIYFSVFIFELGLKVAFDTKFFDTGIYDHYKLTFTIVAVWLYDVFIHQKKYPIRPVG